MRDQTKLLTSMNLEIQRELASGGMGAVFLATQYGVEGFQKTVAVKTLLEEFTSDSEFTKMFIGEAKLVADLVHQNIAQVYQLGQADGRLYIVMEYVEGVDLYRFIKRHRATDRRVPVEIAAYIASRISRGLEYAHNKRDLSGRALRVVHRDISPNNVMITRLGEIKILDFGVAKARNIMADRKGSPLVGKFSYMSPEMASRRGSDRRSDLFSLGVVLWELLTGKRRMPAGGGLSDWMARAKAGTVAPIRELMPDLPEMVVEIVERALKLDPEERYQDAGKMSYDLEYFMYHKGYGPTIVTMEHYLREVFPEQVPVGDAEDSTESLPDTISQSDDPADPTNTGTD